MSLKQKLMPNRTVWPPFSALLLWASILIVTGCGEVGPPISAVSGKVTLQGEPVSVGEVVFLSESGYGSSGRLQEDGTFVLVSHQGKGIPPGEYLVAITPPDPDNQPPGVPAEPPSKVSNIPPKYHNFGTSGLVALVEDGANEFQFEMAP